MTDKRMTNKRLAEIEHLNSLGGPGVVRELLQALKAEREYVEELEDEMPSIAGAVGASMYGKRISELEAKLERARELPDQWRKIPVALMPEDMADELQEVLANSRDLTPQSDDKSPCIEELEQVLEGKDG